MHDRAGRWRIQDAWRERLTGPGAPDWFRLHDDRRATCVKRGLGRSVWRVDLGDVVVYVKMVRPTGWASRIKALLIGNPARREWTALLACAARDVPVPEALGLGVQASGSACVLITLGIEPARTFLDAWMNAIQTNAGRRGRTIPLIRAAARLFATAHERGVWHRDAHAGNILVPLTETECAAVFTDLLGAKLMRISFPLRTSMRSLVHFDQRMQRLATRTERLRFLVAYLRMRGRDAELTSADLRSLLIAKQRLQERRAHHLARRWDRRLRGDGKYFAVVRLAGGWRGVVVLQLERQHLDNELRFEGRALDEWEAILGWAVSNVSQGDKLIRTQMRMEPRQAHSVFERLQWTTAGSPAKCAFLEAHRLRHRDNKTSPPHGYLERRCAALVDQCVLLCPERPM